MIKENRILFGVTTKAHTEIGLDELYGLEELGYVGDHFDYGGKNGFNSSFGKFFIIFKNALTLLIKSYKLKPDFIYFNSRIEYTASVRDFTTLLIMKLFYLKKVHFILKTHGSELEELQTDKFIFKYIIFPFLKKNIRAWLFLSTDEINFITSKNLLDSNKLFLTKNIVRIDKFEVDKSFKTTHNIPEDYMVLLFVGRLLEDKGIFYLIEGFAKIRDLFKVKLIIVGDGIALDAINQKIKDFKIEDAVILTGWINEKQVTNYTANADILIYPTYCNEGFPMAIFNSLAAGLCIITTAIRASIDHLKEPENCLWVSSKSSNSIEKAIIKLINNPELMRSMRRNNKIKATFFTKKYVCQNLYYILNSIETNEYNISYREVKNSL